jgi:hypothetical protein
MTIDLDVNKAQALLKSAQELRTHWSGLINNVMNFAIVTNVAVWTLFIQAYIWDFRETQYWVHSYLVLASTISIVLLALWRSYTAYLDNSIAHLYPELIYFEGKLSCPPEYGTSAYLKRNLGSAADFLDTMQNVEHKAKVVAQLVDKKLIGGRGHDKINLLVLIVIFILALIIFVFGIFGFPKIGAGAGEQGVVRTELKVLCGFFSICGIVCMAILLTRWQRKPCKQQVQEIVDQVTKSTGDKLRD